MADYTKISRLIDLWGKFETNHPNADFTEFGRWLSSTQVENNSDPKKFLSKKKSEHKPDKDAIIEVHLQSMHRDKPLEVQIAILLGRMNKYSRLYIKKSFGEDFGITMDEFQFLATAASMDSVRKTDLISMNVIELTTGTEIINRLIRQKLLSQVPSKEDKRTKLIEITAKGKKILFEAFAKLETVSSLVLGNLGPEQQKRLLDTLEYLNQFHATIYLNNKDDSVAEIKEEYLES